MIDVERFWSNVQPSTGCWAWTGFISAGGYGRYGQRPHNFAHRIAYELFFGPIPPGLQLDHLCGVTCCVRPDHLQPVTPRENALRSSSPPAQNARKVVGKCGHELTPKRGRECVPCRIARKQREYYLRQANKQALIEGEKEEG